MFKLRNILYPIIGIPLFILLVWFIAVPTDLIHEQIEEAIANTGNTNIDVAVNGLSKGLLLSLHSDTIDLIVNKEPALQIEDLAFSFSPSDLFNGEVVFDIDGKVANGDINGELKLPAWGNIVIENAQLNAVPYLTRFGINISGNVFSDITIKDETIKVKFEIPDLRIGDASTIIPLLNTFRKLQGSLSIYGNTVTIDAISLEGDKGHARLKGKIVNRTMDLSLEIMPIKEKITVMESMIIGKYIISPGYYVVPIKGPLP